MSGGNLSYVTFFKEIYLLLNVTSIRIKGLLLTGVLENIRKTLYVFDSVHVLLMLTNHKHTIYSYE